MVAAAHRGFVMLKIAAAVVALLGFVGSALGQMTLLGDERYTDKPDKNKFSHPHDALQYLLSGAGEGRAVLGKERRKRAAASRPTKANSKYDLHNWRARA